MLIVLLCAASPGRSSPSRSRSSRSRCPGRPPISPTFHGFELAKLIAERRAIWQAPRPRNALQGIEPSGGIRNVDVRLGGCRHRAQRWATAPAVVSDHRSRRAGCHLGGDLRRAAPRSRRAARSGADMNGQHRPALAARLTQRWVRAYTAHLDPARRDTRRAELASDLWEHEADARRMGLGSLRMNAQMLRRLLAGIPADLSWRRQPRHTGARDTGPRAGSNAVVALGLSGPRAPLRHQAHPEQPRRRRYLPCLRTLQPREAATAWTSHVSPGVGIGP